MSLFLSPKSQSSFTSFHSFQILKYDEPTNQWIDCSFSINGSSLIIEPKNSEEHSTQQSYYLYQSNFQLKKHISFSISNTQQQNVLEIQFANQPPQPAQTLFVSFATELLLNSCYESIINSSEATFNFPFQSGEKEINVSFSEACDNIDTNNNNNNEDTFNLSPSFSSKCTKSRNNNNNVLSPLQYKAHSHKDNITNLFELSIKQSANQLKMENITPIKSYMKCIVNTQTHSGNNKSTNINQRYLYYDFDDASINEDNINQNSPSDNSFSALNCLNMFNSNLQSSPQNKISFLAKAIDSYEIFIYDSYLLKKVIKENNLTRIDIGNLYKQLKSRHIKIQLLTEMIARISKQHLKVILSNKTQTNSNQLFNPDEAIITVFNLFLGNNKQSIDLYEKTLPGELNDLYQIEIILNIKSRISLHNLFAMMQYHNKVYFNDNYNINFDDETPFISHDIKYISPYLIEKIFNSIVTNPTDVLSLTSLKRLPNALSDCSSTLKSYHLNSDEARIDLINSIYSFIPFKKWELCGRVCEYYLSKYSSTLFLNSMIYMVLAEIYNVTATIESSKVFFEKGIEILNWLYPNGNCHLICDAYYSYSLLLMKQSDTFVNENIEEINKVIDKALLLGKEFYEGHNKERYLKIKMNYYLFRCLFRNESNNAEKDVFNGGLLWDNIVSDLEEMCAANKTEGEIYVRMFMELIERDKKKKEVFAQLKRIISV